MSERKEKDRERDKEKARALKSRYEDQPLSSFPKSIIQNHVERECEVSGTI